MTSLSVSCACKLGTRIFRTRLEGRLATAVTLANLACSTEGCPPKKNIKKNITSLSVSCARASMHICRQCIHIDTHINTHRVHLQRTERRCTVYSHTHAHMYIYNTPTRNEEERVLYTQAHAHTYIYIYNTHTHR